MKNMQPIEDEIDLDGMSQHQINKLVVGHLLALRKDVGPVVDAFRTAGMVAKWATAAVVFLSALIASIYELRNLFHKTS